MKNLFTLILWLCTCSLCLAQEPLQFRLRHDVPLATAAGPLAMPWSGGMSTPQFSTIDLNQDGQDDLFIFDRMQRKVFTYLAVQQNGQWRYQYAPQYEVFFPDDLEQWVLLRDYNCDGLKDIFTSSPLGIRVFRQEPPQNEKLSFAIAEDPLFYLGSSGRDVNMQMNAADIPAIVDLDGDGDLDVLISEFSRGYTLEYYQNQRVEQGLGCNELKFRQATNWWGQITECEGCNNFLFGAFCRVAAPQHTSQDGSALLALDLTGNGVKDLLMGSVMCDNLVMMENKGSRTEARMDAFSAAFPASKPAGFKRFPAAFYEDVNFDGKPDLLVAPNSSENEYVDMELQRSSWLYRNKGSGSIPDFEFVKDNFLQEHMLDLGEGAYPVFADMDGDGLPDLLVGNGSAMRNGNRVATLHYFRNTGTAETPAFTLVSDDYLGLSARAYIHLKPTIADVNGDGVPDLVLTYTRQDNNTTTIAYIPNTGQARQAFQLEAQALQTLREAANGDAPAFVDVDNDGDLDMLVGKNNGRLEFFRNTGSARNPVYTLEKQNLGGLDFNFFRRNVYPTIADVNGNGTPDLLITDDSGLLYLYPDFTQNLDGTFEPVTELLENELTGGLQHTRFGKGLSIAVAPLGAENKLHAVIGTQGGGLYLLEQTKGNLPGTPTDPQAGISLEVYPNPYGFLQQDTPLKVSAAAEVAVVIYDTVGRRVFTTGDSFSKVHQLRLPRLRAGLYLVRATTRSGNQQTRTVLMR